MHLKKLMSAGTALCLAATSLISTGAMSFNAIAADDTLVFDIRSGEQNEYSISAAKIASGDVTVPVSIYISENPGVCAMNLKFQVNDGEIDQNNVFHNYGLYLQAGDFAEPNVFAAAEETSQFKYFVPENMNLSWVYTVDANTNGVAADEANTTAWSNASWAYDKAFATASLVVPKDTPAGEYKFDIRTEPYTNTLSAAADTPQLSASKCAAADSETSLAFKSVPLTIKVEEAVQTTTTEPTTTTSTETTTFTTTTELTTTTSIASSTTTTETSTSLVETTTTSSAPYSGEGDPWVDDYKIEGKGHYLIMGDVSGQAGKNVKVPIYVYGDTGTAGVNLKFAYDKALTLNRYLSPSVEEIAYELSDERSVELYPATFTGITSDGKNAVAADGKILLYLQFAIPADAANGTVYNVSFADGFADICDTDGVTLDVKLFNGTVTVINEGETRINREKINFSKVGDTANLTVFNANGEITWTSSDPAVATVDQNGFVTATGTGAAVITAQNGDYTFTSNVVVGLFGDANLSGTVTIEDAKTVLNEHVLVNLTFGDPSITDPAARYNADVDGDGKLSMQDAKYILNYVVMEMSFLEPTWYEVTGNPNAPDAP